MNREIKFRARNNKCWIYCDAIINGWAILNENGGMAKINPETVGQYTGLKDKNGKEIYEGDIVLIDKENNIKGIVKYSEVFAQFIIVNTNSFADEAEPLGDYEDLEILGNEYENPELLEE